MLLKVVRVGMKQVDLVVIMVQQFVDQVVQFLGHMVQLMLVMCGVLEEQELQNLEQELVR